MRRSRQDTTCPAPPARAAAGRSSPTPSAQRRHPRQRICTQTPTRATPAVLSVMTALRCAFRRSEPAAEPCQSRPWHLHRMRQSELERAALPNLVLSISAAVADDLCWMAPGTRKLNIANGGARVGSGAGGSEDPDWRLAASVSRPRGRSVERRADASLSSRAPLARQPVSRRFEPAVRWSERHQAAARSGDPTSRSRAIDPDGMAG